MVKRVAINEVDRIQPLRLNFVEVPLDRKREVCRTRGYLSTDNLTIEERPKPALFLTTPRTVAKTELRLAKNVAYVFREELDIFLKYPRFPELAEIPFLLRLTVLFIVKSVTVGMKRDRTIRFASVFH